MCMNDENVIHIFLEMLQKEKFKKKQKCNSYTTYNVSSRSYPADVQGIPISK